MGFYSHPNPIPGHCGLRLSLSSSDPVTSSDVTAATTLYALPFVDDRVVLRNAAGNWVEHATGSAGISASLSGLTSNTNYDVWCYSNAGAALELFAWTNGTTRATALARQDGAVIKSGAATRLYLGTIRTTGTTGQCEDSLTKRYVWNWHRPVSRRLAYFGAEQSHTYAGTIREFNGATNRIEFVCGMPGGVDISASAFSKAAAAGSVAVFCAAIDTTSVISEPYFYSQSTSEQNVVIPAPYQVAAGYHYAAVLERGDGASGGTFRYPRLYGRILG